MKSSNSKTFHIQTTEMGIPLCGQFRAEPKKHRWLLELDAPFASVPPAQRISVIYNHVIDCPNYVEASHLLRTIFKAMIHIHQNTKVASDALILYQARKAVLEEQITALRQQKRQLVKEIKAEKESCPEKHKQISQIANETGMLKQKLKKIPSDSFDKIFPEAIDASYCQNFEGYISGPGQCPNHRKEVLHLAQLRTERKPTLQKAFARGWEMLVRQIELDRHISKSDLCRQMEISAAETEEFLSKLTWVCRKHQLPCLADVAVPDDDDIEKTLHGPIQIRLPICIPSFAKPTAKFVFHGLPNPFEYPDIDCYDVIIHY